MFGSAWGAEVDMVRVQEQLEAGGRYLDGSVKRGAAMKGEGSERCKRLLRLSDLDSSIQHSPDQRVEDMMDEEGEDLLEGKKL